MEFARSTGIEMFDRSQASLQPFETACLCNIAEIVRGIAIQQDSHLDAIASPAGRRSALSYTLASDNNPLVELACGPGRGILLHSDQVVVSRKLWLQAFCADPFPGSALHPREHRSEV
jgi:hypothetical protein